MCSKKWAKPDLPGSTSLRDPVWTGIWIETMLGKPVGTTMTLRPLASTFSVALKGRIGVSAFADMDRLPRISVSAARRMKSPLSTTGFHLITRSRDPLAGCPTDWTVDCVVRLVALGLVRARGRRGRERAPLRSAPLAPAAFHGGAMVQSGVRLRASVSPWFPLFLLFSVPLWFPFVRRLVRARDRPRVACPRSRDAHGVIGFRTLGPHPARIFQGASRAAPLGPACPRGLSWRRDGPIRRSPPCLRVSVVSIVSAVLCASVVSVRPPARPRPGSAAGRVPSLPRRAWRHWVSDAGTPPSADLSGSLARRSARSRLPPRPFMAARWSNPAFASVSPCLRGFHCFCCSLCLCGFRSSAGSSAPGIGRGSRALAPATRMASLGFGRWDPTQRGSFREPRAPLRSVPLAPAALHGGAMVQSGVRLRVSVSLCLCGFRSSVPVTPELEAPRPTPRPHASTSSVGASRTT